MIYSKTKKEWKSGMAKRQRKCYGLLDVDIENLVCAQSIVYENAAIRWQDGHILGNGDLGAVAYVPYWMEWTVNKVDVFDGRNAPVNRKLTYAEVLAEAERRGTRQTFFLDEIEQPVPGHTGPREPQLKSCGQVKLRCEKSEYSWGPPPPYSCRHELSLWKASDTMSLELTGISRFEKVHDFQPVITSFVSRCRNVLAIRVQEAQGPLWAKNIELVRPPDADYPAPVFGKSPDNSMVWLEQRCPDGTTYAMALGVAITGGVFEFHDPMEKADRREPAGISGAKWHGDRGWITAKGDCDIFIGAASSRETADPLALAKQLVTTALQDGYEKLAAEHHSWWRTFWRRSFVQLQDAPIREQLWYIGIYQMGSSLGRVPIPGIEGLWYGFTDSAVQNIFHAVYTMDINIQSASMPAWMVNHPELGIPFIETFLSALPMVHRLTRERFDRPGAGYFPLEICLDPAIGEPSFGSSYRLSMTGGPLTGLLFCWAWRTTRDEKLLREKIYPFLREIARFWTAFLEKDRDGRYLVPWLVPCEVNTFSRNAMDIVSTLKPCLETAIEGSRLLDIDADERAQWQGILDNYPDYPRAKGRFIFGSDFDPAQESYHHAQLWPLTLTHDERPAIKKLIRRTLDYWYPDHGDYSSPGYSRNGWPMFCTFPGMFELLALLYLEYPAAVNRGVDHFIKFMLKPNGLMPHMPLSVKKARADFRELIPTCPEANTYLVTVLTQMLLQSHNNLVRIFPGMTGQANARFGDLRAEGAFLVSAEMLRGKVTFVSITAEVGGTARVLNPWKGKRVALSRGKRKPEIIGGEILEIATVRGRTVILVPVGYKTAMKRIACDGIPSVKTAKYKDGTVLTLGKGRPSK